MTEQAAKQTLAAFDFDDIEAVDSLTDDEIDEILLSIIGDESDQAGSLEFDYYDDYEVQSTQSRDDYTWCNTPAFF